ncbi:MerR family transcriptional regulator [Leuconostoc suionicum]|uniref:MerR family transcriptional regulator n=1 Tax=Leuconostoc suionicum TaxID=1511761 RepID=UPI0024ACECB0|nr:MerR family transcriptional regulator [Leuconostoc suionicum]MDI6523821.1 MerR family transcriptional regulator [Leuconostoc suionicum]
MENEYKISEVSKLTELPISTLRYYESLELLVPKRNNKNYRIYTQNDLNWIHFISRAKATGMSLSKIIQYAKLREQGNQTINERLDILDEQEAILNIEKSKILDHIAFIQSKKDLYRSFLGKSDKNEHD